MASPPPAESRSPLDLPYLKTLDGGLKLGAIFFSLPGVICAAVSQNRARQYYEFHASLAIICSSALLLIYVSRLVYRLNIPWFVLETCYCGLMALLFLIGMICMFAAPLTHTHKVHCQVQDLDQGTCTVAETDKGASYAAGALAIPVIACFALDCFKKYRAWRSGNKGPGQQLHTLADPMSGATSPASTY